MNKKSGIFVFVLASLFLLVFPLYASGDLKTASEKSNFSRQTSYSETIDYLEHLQSQSPNVKLLYYGKSLLGRRLPLVLITDPPVSAPWQVIFSRKPTILVTSQIHGNEPAGKEAALII
ncbi:MAG: hypothetical protein J7M18_08775, partial [Candidatus Eremiobacteraeota bacterium]|nr:hypothetical protein [Candidatus Eremiobacteraeota bacterium]